MSKMYNPETSVAQNSIQDVLFEDSLWLQRVTAILRSAFHATLLPDRCRPRACSLVEMHPKLINTPESIRPRDPVTAVGCLVPGGLVWSIQPSG